MGLLVPGDNRPSRPADSSPSDQEIKRANSPEIVVEKDGVLVQIVGTARSCVDKPVTAGQHIDRFYLQAPEPICEIFASLLISVGPEGVLAGAVKQDEVTFHGYPVIRLVNRDLETATLETARNTIVKVVDIVPTLRPARTHSAVLTEETTTGEMLGNITVHWNDDTQDLQLVLGFVPDDSPHSGFIGKSWSIPVENLELDTWNEEECPVDAITKLRNHIYLSGIACVLPALGSNDLISIYESSDFGGSLVLPPVLSLPEGYNSATDGSAEETERWFEAATRLGAYIPDQVKVQSVVPKVARVYFMTEELAPGRVLATLVVGRIGGVERSFWSNVVDQPTADNLERLAKNWVKCLPNERLQYSTLEKIWTAFGEQSFRVYPGCTTQTPVIKAIADLSRTQKFRDWLEPIGQGVVKPYYTGGREVADLTEGVATYAFTPRELPQHLSWAVLIVRQDLTSNALSLRLIPSMSADLGTVFVDVSVPGLDGAEASAFDNIKLLEPILFAFSRGAEVGGRLEDALERSGVVSTMWGRPFGVPSIEPQVLRASEHARALVSALASEKLVRDDPTKVIKNLERCRFANGLLGCNLTLNLFVPGHVSYRLVTFNIYENGPSSVAIHIEDLYDEKLCSLDSDSTRHEDVHEQARLVTGFVAEQYTRWWQSKSRA